MPVVRRCLKCRAYVTGASYCRTCKPQKEWPAEAPGRVSGSRLRKWRAELYELQGGRCGMCGKPWPLAGLQMHHKDHDFRNDDPQNHVLLDLGCHVRAGRGESPWG
jgi:hypothetical protein